MNGEKVLDISWKTIAKIFVALLLFYIIYQIRDVLVWFLFALIISILFEPIINFLKKIKIPRALAVAFVYIAFFGVVTLIIYIAIPLFVSESRQFSEILPQYFERISPPLKGLGFSAFKDINAFLASLDQNLEKISHNIFNVLFAIFGGIFATIFSLSLAIYISLAERGVEKALLLFFPKKYEPYIVSLWQKSRKKVSGWFFTRVLACLFVGLLSLLALWMFNTAYPFTLAILAGAFNFIPIIGPVIAGVLLALVVGLESLKKAVFVVLAYALIQQLENNIVSPLLSKKFVGIPPVLVLLSLAVGGILWGFLGSILTIPLAGILYEFVKEFLEKKRAQEQEAL